MIDGLMYLALGEFFVMVTSLIVARATKDKDNHWFAFALAIFFVSLLALVCTTAIATAIEIKN
nr:hypothetical protein [Candidatus Sigynarchaeota archaeon]